MKTMGKTVEVTKEQLVDKGSLWKKTNWTVTTVEENKRNYFTVNKLC